MILQPGENLYVATELGGEVRAGVAWTDNPSNILGANWITVLDNKLALLAPSVTQGNRFIEFLDMAKEFFSGPPEFYSTSAANLYIGPDSAAGGIIYETQTGTQVFAQVAGKNILVKKVISLSVYPETLWEFDGEKWNRYVNLYGLD
jgi:hypothetical protein